MTLKEALATAELTEEEIRNWYQVSGMRSTAQGLAPLATRKAARVLLGAFREWLGTWLAEHIQEADCDGECLTTRNGFVKQVQTAWDIQLESLEKEGSLGAIL